MEDMDSRLLALAFSMLQWKEARKVEVWEQYCAGERPRLNSEEAQALGSLSKNFNSLLAEARSLGAELTFPIEDEASHLHQGLPYPIALWVRGTLPPATVHLTIVGSRTPTAAGRRAAFCLGRDLTEAGVGIISGLARGIDASAHLGALEKGPTWGILGSGLRNPYPTDNIPLMERIIKSGGGIITCFQPDAMPLKWHFPRRNMIMAAWARGIVVVEAKAKSGSLITAKLALDLGKDLWAMPSHPDNPHAEGSNSLLREGSARFARNAVDVLEDMASILLTGLY
jgi:DNA processing protein